MQEIANTITETIGGYPVKNLKWDSVSNIFIGHVKCPIWGVEKLHDGYVTCQWRSNGSVTAKRGGSTRKDLYLKLT